MGPSEATSMEYRRPRVFIDADVLIAGAASTTGASHVVLRLSELGLIDGIVSSRVVREAERNIERKLPAALPAFRALVAAACQRIGDPIGAEVAAFQEEADPKDVPILAAAVKADCRWLLTFNTRDFRPVSSQLSVAEPGVFVEALRRVLEDIAEHR